MQSYFSERAERVKVCRAAVRSSDEDDDSADGSGSSEEGSSAVGSGSETGSEGSVLEIRSLNDTRLAMLKAVHLRRHASSTRLAQCS